MSDGTSAGYREYDKVASWLESKGWIRHRWGAGRSSMYEDPVTHERLWIDGALEVQSGREKIVVDVMES